MTAPAAPESRPLLALLLALALGLLWAPPAAADKPGRLASAGGIAVGGYDPVAYFRDGTARPGDPAIALRWRGVRWHFATPAHRAEFEADPKAYAPILGGHCAASMADGRPREGDPRHWTILEGRLVLTAEAADLARLLAEPQAILHSARQHWNATRNRANSD